MLNVHSLSLWPCTAFEADRADFGDMPELPETVRSRSAIWWRVPLPLLVLPRRLRLDVLAAAGADALREVQGTNAS